jgi:hypothetical protein
MPGQIQKDEATANLPTLRISARHVDLSAGKRIGWLSFPGAEQDVNPLSITECQVQLSIAIEVSRRDEVRLAARDY